MYEPWVLTTTIPSTFDPSIITELDPDCPLVTWPKDQDPKKPERTGLFMYCLIQENETVCKYIVKFNLLAASANWDVTALVWVFKRGLASCIKDELV